MDEIDDAIESVTDEDHEPQAEAEPMPDDGETPDDDGDGSPIDKLMDLSGTGKPLESYEDSEWRSLVAGGSFDGDTAQEKGELYVARGLDGLLGGVVDIGHPLLDLGIGFVLITLADTDVRESLSDMTDRELAAKGEHDELEKRAEDAEYSGDDLDLS